MTTRYVEKTIDYSGAADAILGTETKRTEIYDKYTGKNYVGLGSTPQESKEAALEKLIEVEAEKIANKQ